MSHWRYQVMRHVADDGEITMAMHEFYVMHDNKKGWTAEPIKLEADTLQDLRKALILMLIDLEDHGVRDVKTGVVIDG